jgi:hypothetical protein
MNAPIAAKFLDRYVWAPNERAEETVLAAALLGEAPTVEPTDLTGWRAVALEVYRASGNDGLVFYQLAERVAGALERYNPTPEQLQRALTVVSRRAERLSLASEALTSLVRLQSLLAQLQRP